MLDYFLKIKKLLWVRGNGQFSSLFHGAGVDIAENRQYSTWDEKRSINRKMSAKYDQMFVNLFHEEKAIDVYVCCDINYNWRYKAQITKHRSQWNKELFATFFAELTSYFQEKKAHITWWLGEEIFLSLEKPVSQKGFLEACDKKIGRALPLYTSKLWSLLAQQRAVAKKRLIIIVSDFLSYGEEEKRQVNVLRQKHEVILLRMPMDEKKVSADMLSLEVFWV